MHLLVAIGIFLVTVAAVAFAARNVRSSTASCWRPWGLAPYLMLGAPLSLIVFGIARHWIFAAVAAALTVATAAVQLPRYVASGAAPGVDVRFVSANLRTLAISGSDHRALAADIVVQQ